VERTVHKSHNFEAATGWTVQRSLSVSPHQSPRAARTLKERAFSSDALDVRECHKTE
jgi:hypothetical protein